MAYWINDVGNRNRPDLKEFYCDSEKDITGLPTSKKKGVVTSAIDESQIGKCSIGSSCFVIDKCKLYILNSKDIWKEV